MTCLVKILGYALLLSPLVGLKAAAADRPPPVVGAIRWDAWYGRNDVVREVERSLGPKKFHFRLPFFAQVVSDAEVRIDGDSQETMNREIAYAAEAGLNYWAFVDYWDDPALTIALRRYRDAQDKRGLRFCFIYAWNENDEGGWLMPTWTAQGKFNTDRIESVGRVLNR